MCSVVYVCRPAADLGHYTTRAQFALALLARHSATVTVIAPSRSSRCIPRSCCACPDTKKLRDDCFLRYGSNVDDEGESRDKCRDIVEAHKRCMRGLGFNV